MVIDVEGKNWFPFSFWPNWKTEKLFWGKEFSFAESIRGLDAGFNLLKGKAGFSSHLGHPVWVSHLGVHMCFRSLPQSNVPTQAPDTIWEALSHLHMAGGYHAEPTEVGQPAGGSWRPRVHSRNLWWQWMPMFRQLNWTSSQPSQWSLVVQLTLK